MDILFLIKKYFLFASILIIFILLSFLLLRTNVAKKENVTAIKPVAEIKNNINNKVDMNKDFVFPVMNIQGKEIGKLKYIIENAELKDEIVVKGQKATLLPGKLFLIINLKLINEQNTSLNINSRDYIRLNVGNNPDFLASDIHNDPVEVQPISTKYTRLGFTINDSEKNFKLQIGEINGEKTLMDVSFK